MATDLGKVQIGKKVGKLTIEDDIVYWKWSVLGSKETLTFPKSDVQATDRPYVFAGRVPVNVKVRLLGDITFLFTGSNPKHRAEQFLREVA